jgi:hypothetical protein
MLPFLTAYDPLGSTSGSIDPLGALQTYTSLADLLLPGVTTITTRSRYLSMICAAIGNAEKYRAFLPGASGLAQRRRAVEPFERLWAIACVAARDDGSSEAADGLRGITYAEKIYRQFAASGTRVNCDFQLLKFQSRTGAVGTYWTAMVGGDLVDANTGALTPQGQELATEFPESRLEEKDRSRLADPDNARRVSMALEDLAAWSEECHLQAAEQHERQQLGEALTASDRRECVRAGLSLMSVKLPSAWNGTHLARLGRKFKTNPRAVDLGLPTVIDAITMTEQFHEAVLVAFETLLWWGSHHAEKPVADLIADKDFKKAGDQCRQTAQSLRDFRVHCERSDVRTAIEGLAGFCAQVARCGSERELVNELISRHHQVQSGKVDGGMPKRDWITWDGSALLRPSPRFQRNERPALATGISLTHPYRLEQFVHMLQETDLLQV